MGKTKKGEETAKKQQSIVFHETNTPFAIAEVTKLEKDELGKETEIHDFIVCVGNQAASGNFATLEEATEYINQKPWQLICALTSVMAQKVYEHETIKRKH